MRLSCPQGVTCLKLRPFSALLVAGYAVLGWIGLGPLGAAVHAIWFALLLTRSGRAILLGASISLGAVGLMGCATGIGFASALAAIFALSLLAASAWLAARGIDHLESLWHGQATESEVRRFLDDMTARAPTAAFVHHGVLLRNGKSFTEIDHVFLTAGGIVVVETKGYAGRIAFDAETGYWSRTKATGRTEGIEDPLAQNDRHVRAVRRLFPDAPVFSLVVMPQATLESSVPSGVVGLSELRQSLDAWIMSQPTQLDVAGLHLRLQGADESSPENRRAHLNWLYKVRRPGVHPLLQRRMAAFAGTLYFGIPSLLLISMF